MANGDVGEARARAKALRESLPQSVDAAALGVWSKAPFQLLCTREALIWRTEELARSACDALERTDFTVAALLARATIESAALAWKLMEVLVDRKKFSPQQLHQLLTCMLVGSRVWSDMPKALQILNCIDKMDEKVPGVRKGYDILSEIAHPNWRGVFGMYAKTDEATFTAHFGRALHPMESVSAPIVHALTGALQLFEFAYNRVSGVMPEFVGELESIWPDGNNEIR